MSDRITLLYGKIDELTQECAKWKDDAYSSAEVLSECRASVERLENERDELRAEVTKRDKVYESNLTLEGLRHMDAVKIRDLEAEVERLKGEVNYWYEKWQHGD